MNNDFPSNFCTSARSNCHSRNHKFLKESILQAVRKMTNWNCSTPQVGLHDKFWSSSKYAVPRHQPPAVTVTYRACFPGSLQNEWFLVDSVVHSHSRIQPTNGMILSVRQTHMWVQTHMHFIVKIKSDKCENNQKKHKQKPTTTPKNKTTTKTGIWYMQHKKQQNKQIKKRKNLNLKHKH